MSYDEKDADLAQVNPVADFKGPHTSGFVQSSDMPPPSPGVIATTTYDPGKSNTRNSIIAKMGKVRTGTKKQYFQPDKDQKTKQMIVDAFDGSDDGEKCFKAFCKYQYRLSTQIYWALLREVWLAAGSNLSRRRVFYDLFSSAKANRKMLMLKNEEEFYANLPDMAALYQPMRGDTSFAWYTTEAQAWEIARKVDAAGVMVCRVPKRMIFAVFMIGGFTEALIIEPEHILWLEYHGKI